MDKTEAELFIDLESLCKSSGFAHVIAYLCFRDNMIANFENLQAEIIVESFSRDRLIRTEISTLIGLMIKGSICLKIPESEKFHFLVQETEKLLAQIHESLNQEAFVNFDLEKVNEENYNPFKAGSVMREAIFYGSESAFNFQYRDLFPIKYKDDNEWFIKNKKYSISDAHKIVCAIESLQLKKISDAVEEAALEESSNWTMLSGFTFEVIEIVKITEFDADIVRNVIYSFCKPDDDFNENFNSLGDFNIINAYPILEIKRDKFILFQCYSLLEALYETPFFWFNSDQSYRNQAMYNRGEFTENYSLERLASVFGNENVFKSVEIRNNKKEVVGEIDVFVLFANRAIIVQAKSKKLTIAARKGNDNILKDDFKKAIQNAYDQALSCAELINSNSYILYQSSGEKLKLNVSLKEVYLFCIISDHYPALNFQSLQFLNYKTNNKIMAPFVMDVFFLDVLSEMLKTPLYFLSYINRRVGYGERVYATNELPILSYHLKNNLWIENKNDFLHISDDLSADLDVAMMVRRDNLIGRRTPDGILTNYEGTFFSQAISEIEEYEDPGTIELGFMLLQLSQDSVNDINLIVDKLVSFFKKDNSGHDTTLIFDDTKTGLTIHCNNESNHVSFYNLLEHCKRRKYIHKFDSWFGICINPEPKKLRFGISLDFKWKYSENKERLTKNLPQLKSIAEIKNINPFQSKKRKIGRNEKCPCGSGKKYKKCCLKI